MAARPASASTSPSSYLDQSIGGSGGGAGDIGIESDLNGGGYNHWKNLENGHSLLYGRRSNSVGNLYSGGQDFYDGHYNHLPNKPIGHTTAVDKSTTEQPPAPPLAPPPEASSPR